MQSIRLDGWPVAACLTISHRVGGMVCSSGELAAREIGSNSRRRDYVVL